RISRDAKNAFLLLLEICLDVCFLEVDSISEMGNVAIRKLAASTVRAIFAGSQLSSFDSRWSLRMPIVVGSSVAIRNCGDRAVFFREFACGKRRSSETAQFSE